MVSEATLFEGDIRCIVNCPLWIRCLFKFLISPQKIQVRRPLGVCEDELSFPQAGHSSFLG